MFEDRLWKGFGKAVVKEGWQAISLSPCTLLVLHPGSHGVQFG